MTARELAFITGKSKNEVNHYLKKLSEKGLIRVEMAPYLIFTPSNPSKEFPLHLPAIFV